MGTWSYGNFDDDTSADHLSIMTGRLVEEITKAMAEPHTLEPDEYWGCAVPCNIEILNLFARQGWVGLVLPKPAVAAQWRTTYLAVWDGAIDQLAPESDYKAKRRAVLVRTFDELLEHARRGHDET
jgi:hypothetical protein